MTYIQLMVRIGLNDAELAKAVCIGRMTAYRWNRALKVPSLMGRKALAKLGRVRADDVVWERAK